MRRAWPWALAGAALLAACGSDAPVPVASEEYEAIAADNVMWDVEHTMTVEGVRRALLRADTAWVYEDSARTQVANPRLMIFDTLGTATAELTAERGWLNFHTQAMLARGNVVLETRDGNRRIETEELHFDPEANRIWSEVPSTMRENGSVIRGEGFEWDTRTQNMRIVRPRGRVEGLRIEF